MSDLDAAFAASRQRLIGLAYRMLGSRTEAEDIAQETYLRAAKTDFAEVRSPEAFLIRIATNLCITELQSARRRREAYVGPWLPEPIPDTESLTPDRALEYADDLSFALLLTLEKLTPPERAAFLLAYVFDLPFAEIAQTLGRPEATCRQLAARAAKAVKSDRPARKVAPEQHRRLLMQFADAISRRDVAGLAQILAADAVAYSDGGGVARAALNPIEGPDRIARYFIGLEGKLERKSVDFRPRLDVRPCRVNGADAFLVYIDGALDQTVSIETDGRRITAVYVVRNPAKLAAMRP